jgi:hypothetical protein
VRKWLQLRLHAWLRGRSVELVQVTPHYLQQIDVSHCPITRAPLSIATLEAPTLGRPRAQRRRLRRRQPRVMSTKANHAKAATACATRCSFVQRDRGRAASAAWAA